VSEDKGSRLERGHLVMIVAHRAMVRDLREIADAADRWSRAADRSGTTALVDYAGKIIEIIEHHHAGEDASLWPMLTERGAPAETIRLLTGEHAELNEQVERVKQLHGEVTGGGTGDAWAEFAKATVRLREVLAEHTGDEERELAGSLAPALGPAEWKTFEKAMLKTAPKWTLLFMPPWLTSAATEQERKGLPAPPVARMMRGNLARRRASAFAAPA
jgi:hemerythrin-like domain-containing protein